MVLLLIDLFREHKRDFASSIKRKTEVWRAIAAAMNNRGYDVTADACDKKWSNLKISYKRIKDNNGQTGRSTMRWRYFTLMQEALDNDPSIVPPVLISSFGGPQVRVADATASRSSSTPPSPVPVSPSSMQRFDVEEQHPTLDGLPPIAKRRRRSSGRNEPPSWLQQWLEKSSQFMQTQIEDSKKKTELLEKLIDKL